MTEIAGQEQSARGIGLKVEGLVTHIKTDTGVVRAVNGVTFSIGPGETVGLVGESGCGKSMTGMSIMRLLPGGGRIESGSIMLGDRDLTKLSEEEMRRVRGDEVAMVFQDPMQSLNPTMTIGNQIAETVLMHRDASKREARDRALEVLDLVGMPRPAERVDAFPHQLSGGLRQRVAIAMALACEPRVLIADEPTTALDVTIQGQILELLGSLRERLGMSLLLITHDLGVIAGWADKVVVMYAGRAAEEARTDELYTQPRHPYTQALLESVPGLETDRSQALYSIPGMPPDLTRDLKGCPFAPRCRHVMEQCRVQEPPVNEQGGHMHVCFIPGKGVSDPAVQAIEVSPVAAGARTPVAPTDEHKELMVLNNVVREFPFGRTLSGRRRGVVHAVSGVSFSIYEGEVLGLVGESGCGKTTLGRLIAGLEKPDGGEILFEGENIASLKGAALRRRRRDLQLMFQDSAAALDPRMKVGASVGEPLRIQRIGTKQERQKNVEALLEQVGMNDAAADRYPYEFSGGQRQRLGLARALSLSPKMLVADEPVSALDVSIQSQILNLMRRLQDENRLTYLIISHDLSVVRYLADRVGVMYLGKLVEIGTAASVYEETAHPYTAGLLGAIPVPDPVSERKRSHASIRGELPSAADPPSGCRFRTRCPIAQDVCAEKEPSLDEFGPGGHRVACHFPLHAQETPASGDLEGVR
jgi:peptide/nickel transport system ATP-binding protein